MNSNVNQNVQKHQTRRFRRKLHLEKEKKKEKENQKQNQQEVIGLVLKDQNRINEIDCHGIDNSSRSTNNTKIADDKNYESHQPNKIPSENESENRSNNLDYKKSTKNERYITEYYGDWVDNHHFQNLIFDNRGNFWDVYSKYGYNPNLPKVRVSDEDYAMIIKAKKFWNLRVKYIKGIYELSEMQDLLTTIINSHYNYYYYKHKMTIENKMVKNPDASANKMDDENQSQNQSESESENMIENRLSLLSSLVMKDATNNASRLFQQLLQFVFYRLNVLRTFQILEPGSVHLNNTQECGFKFVNPKRNYSLTFSRQNKRVQLELNHSGDWNNDHQYIFEFVGPYMKKFIHQVFHARRLDQLIIVLNKFLSCDYAFIETMTIV